MGLITYLDNVIANLEIRNQQLEQEKQVLLQRIAELEDNTVKDVVELEDK